jgi:hypothetical protein
MKRFSQIAALALAAAFAAGCGGSDDAGDGAGPSASASRGTTSSPTENVIDEPSVPAEPEYKKLSKAELEDALLSINELPAGYARDPSGDGPTDDDDTYCGYKPPAQPDVKVRHDYLKGGGLSASLLSFSIGQYDSEDGPQGYLDDFAKQLDKCTSENLDGETVKYALMSAPQVGDQAMGVRVEGDAYTLAADMAKVGPVLIVVGGGGLMDLNVDQINDLFEKQVEKYLEAAKN